MDELFGACLEFTLGCQTIDAVRERKEREKEKGREKEKRRKGEKER
jgi:hypothetical protein